MFTAVLGWPRREIDIMSNAKFAIAALLVCAAPAASADENAPANTPARYSFNRVEDGFLRLDNRVRAGCALPLACGRLGLRGGAGGSRGAGEGDRTPAGRSCRLKSKLAALQEPPPPRPPADLSPGPPRDDTGNCAKTSIRPGQRSKMLGTGWSTCS